MKILDKTKKNVDIAISRFGIVGKLISKKESERLINQGSNNTEEFNLSDRENLCSDIEEDIAKKWLYRYNSSGLAGLYDTEIDDTGKILIPEKIADKIRTLRSIHPRWTTPQIISALKNEKIWDGSKPDISELKSFIERSNLTRTGAFSLQKKLVSPEYSGDLWYSDFMICPKLYIGKNKKNIYLHAIVDNATKEVIIADFYTEESSEIILSDLKKAAGKHGLPRSLCVDNGFAFKTRDLKVVSQRLNISLLSNSHAILPYRAATEKFFFSVKTRFFGIQRFRTLDDIRIAFQNWLSQYNDSRKEVSCLSVKSGYRKIPDYINIEPLFYMERRCKVEKNGTLKLKKRIYFLPVEFHSKKRVVVHFAGDNLSKIFVGPDYLPVSEVIF